MRAVIGLHPQDDEGCRAAHGRVWFKTKDARVPHQHAMDCVAVRPLSRHGRLTLTSGRSIRRTSADLRHAGPMILRDRIAVDGYKKLAFTSVGESACAIVGKALRAGSQLTIPSMPSGGYAVVATTSCSGHPPRFLPKVARRCRAEPQRSALSDPTLRDPGRRRGRTFRQLRRQGEEGLGAPIHIYRPVGGLR